MWAAFCCLVLAKVNEPVRLSEEYIHQLGLTVFGPISDLKLCPIKWQLSENKLAVLYVRKWDVS